MNWGSVLWRLFEYPTIICKWKTGMFSFSLLTIHVSVYGNVMNMLLDFRDFWNQKWPLNGGMRCNNLIIPRWKTVVVGVVVVSWAQGLESGWCSSARTTLGHVFQITYGRRPVRASTTWQHYHIVMLLNFLQGLFARNKSAASYNR
jgi:hypothetical protein